MVIEFLHRIGDVLKDYLNELLDEMMDNGFPLTTEPNILKSMILPPTTIGRMVGTVTGNSAATVVSELPDGTLSNVPWRKAGAKYSNNEIYFDIIEEIDCIIDNSGSLVTCEVMGSIQCN